MLVPTTRNTIKSLCLCLGISLLAVPLASASELRQSPIVKAVAKAKASVVNIHSEKLVAGADNKFGHIETSRRVNGMGTGVVIDERGYIVTNQHVVDGVEKIKVTLFDATTYDARLISSDRSTDLAVIKIDVPFKMQVITIGTSSDLMTGESVIAVGNAYGYEHTVTRGIISALNRMVQLNETQKYENLIQTDASINPGNSGGPLLNIDGEMIGINVAVRAGAQGIGFAIPVDNALKVIAELISTKRLENMWHGIVATSSKGCNLGLLVNSLDAESPALKSGLKQGDVLTAVDGHPLLHPLDLERALLGRKSGEEVELSVLRNEKKTAVKLTMAAVEIRAPVAPVVPTDTSWNLLGVKLESVPTRQFLQYRTRYRGGLWVTEVDAQGPAAQQGIHPGDILVGLHIWETVTQENVSHILGRADLKQIGPLKFYVLRNGRVLASLMPMENQ